MASATFEIEIATPDRLLIREHVSEAQIPGEGGMLGILPEHAPLISTLGSGELSYVAGGVRRFMAVSGGYVEVLPGGVRVLADHAEFADDIDLKRAETALKRANERLIHPTPGLDTARALNAMKRAQARLEAARHAGHRK
jgi:F-type H+-transporting ATPase subunit epsilon